MSPPASFEPLAAAFQARWGVRPRVFRAPGRVNLIGEHTDYNDGFVLPAALECSTWAAAALREDRVLAVHSENFAETREFPLDDPAPAALGHWSDYVRGVSVVLERADHRLRGVNLLLRGEVPIGAGLSSSAALEVAVALALLELSGIVLDRAAIARLCQRAENEFVGMRCGIMDQFIACHARAGHALLLDCRSLGFRTAALPPGVSLVVANTMVRHELAAGEYNSRRADCEAGVRRLAEGLSGIQALRDVTLEDLETHVRDLPDRIFRRCRHVVRENLRVEQAFAALALCDPVAFGSLMVESHLSLRDDYEVSCPELDRMVEIALGLPGVYGARMTGGGFGGCTVNLVQEESVDEFRTALARRYRETTGLDPVLYVSGAASAAGEVL